MHVIGVCACTVGDAGGGDADDAHAVVVASPAATHITAQQRRHPRCMTGAPYRREARRAAPTSGAMVSVVADRSRSGHPLKKAAEAALRGST
jgi:hypothetical protein